MTHYQQLLHSTTHYHLTKTKHYYKTIIDATDNSMILYFTFHSLNRVKISLDQFANLLENGKVIGVQIPAADFYRTEGLELILSLLVSSLSSSELYHRSGHSGSPR